MAGRKAKKTSQPTPRGADDETPTPAFDALNDRQQAFVRHLIEGQSAIGAYRLAYNLASDAPNYAEASLLRRNPKVLAALVELREAGGITGPALSQRMRDIVFREGGLDGAAMERLAKGETTLAELAQEGVDTSIVESVQALQGGGIKYTTTSVLGAAKLLSDSEGLIVQRQQVEHQGDVQVVVRAFDPKTDTPEDAPGGEIIAEDLPVLPAPEIADRADDGQTNRG